MAVRFALTRGQFALIDEADLPLIAPLRWIASPRNSSLGGYYAISASSGTTFYMHRLLLAAPPHLQVDHIDGNGLNNCRANLRLATQSQNNANRDVPVSSTGFRGVQVAGHNRNRFMALVGSRPNLWKGPHRASAEEAARDYDAEARQRFGEFARLNFPTEATGA